MTAPPVDLTALDALAEAVAKADALEAECPFNMPGYKAETCKRCRAKASDSCGASDLAAHQALRAVRNAYPALKAEIEALRGAVKTAREDALDAAWRAVDAEGGVGADPEYATALDHACTAIERLGGMDPVCRRIEREVSAETLAALGATS